MTPEGSAPSEERALRQTKTATSWVGTALTRPTENICTSESKTVRRSGRLTLYFLIFVNRCMQETINFCSFGKEVTFKSAKVELLIKKV